MELTFWILFFGAVFSSGQSDLLESEFNTGNLPLHSTVNIKHFAEMDNVHSTIQCVGACVQHQGCVAIVMTDGSCKMYDRRASGSSWVAQRQSVYMELKDDEIETTEAMITTAEDEFLAGLDCPTTRTCSSLSADAVFVHSNESYVVITGNEYYSFESVQNMCSGLPYQNGMFSDLVAPPFTDNPEMIASVNNGGESSAMFVFKEPEVLVYFFMKATGKYTWEVTRSLRDWFPSILVDGGNCFLAHDESDGTLFKGDRIYTNSLEFTRDERFHSNLTSTENPFFNYMPPGNPHACTQTSVDGLTLFFDHENIYLYNSAAKKHTSLGKLCKG
ncbi:hypothetical protein CAPTEDRAFT_212433 [Capitella teleta]|uniref:Apple domain-containing protein n=1 Tax=Capitella teleta TaxID=283909 RepID=R7T4R4_CAPTE|nr:hypothetical protein CAPTEDRAFT_212433 [Capitella teleta]|eukprot:ELT88072.1 hypothetical protein CAPTEDRAFT_212433 [Capitella teleta]